ncbi:MAG: HDOD domain-containing protein [Chitinispirillaceae bacterium]|nr:HDOD domain-containing protein [Chitinispirillaceae bacterium]
MRLIQRLSEIQNLPTLPEIVLRIQRLVMSEEGNATLLARIIEQDPSLSAKILKVSNSSYYCSTSGKITSISNAITRVGFNEVGHIALAVNFVRQFSHHSNVLDYKTFWKHSLTSAYLCALIADNNHCGRFKPGDRHLLFLAGLLHDIGILLYDQFFHSDFEAIIREAVDGEIPFLSAEKKMVPDEMHGLVGGVLLNLWKIDQAIVSAVRYHHAPDKAPESFRLFSFVTYLAEFFLCNSVVGSFEGTMETRPYDVYGELNVTSEIVSELYEKALSEVERSDLMSAISRDTAGSRLRTI